jgi:hypothetical protein
LIESQQQEKPMRMLAAIAVVVVLLMSTRGESQNAPPPGVPDDAASNSAHWEHVRLDDIELGGIGGGSVDRGLTAMGGRGFRLFGVTTRGDDGRAGWHLFKRQPWDRPAARPRFECRRVDDAIIQGLANGDFAAGMRRFEADG